MTELKIKQLDELRYRISRLNNLLSSLEGKNGYCDISMHLEDKVYIREYAGKKIEELNKKIEEL